MARWLVTAGALACAVLTVACAFDPARPFTAVHEGGTGGQVGNGDDGRATGGAGSRTVFEMADPPGDDNGPGTFVYPLDRSFYPYSGLFDLTFFRVASGGGRVVFDVELGRLANPWEAPEGFSHQLIDVYIDTVRDRGRTEPLRTGANVRFAPKFAWDVQVRIAPWGASRVWRADDTPSHPGRQDGIDVAVLPDSRTIRASVPTELVGEPSRDWGYYVLVGSQDAFGPDGYRPVEKESGPWNFGGGSNLSYDPNVIDVLAPPGPSGPRSQRRMLGSWSEHDGVMATIWPVGPGIEPPGTALAGVVAVSSVLALALATAAVVALLRILRSRHR